MGGQVIVSAYLWTTSWTFNWKFSRKMNSKDGIPTCHNFLLTMSLWFSNMGTFSCAVCVCVCVLYWFHSVAWGWRVQ